MSAASHSILMTASEYLNAYTRLWVSLLLTAQFSRCSHAMHFIAFNVLTLPASGSRALGTA